MAGIVTMLSQHFSTLLDPMIIIRHVFVDQHCSAKRSTNVNLEDAKLSIHEIIISTNHRGNQFLMQAYF